MDENSLIEVDDKSQLDKLLEAYEVLKSIGTKVDVKGSGYVLSFEKGNVRVHGIGVFSQSQFEEILKSKVNEFASL